VRLWLVAGSEWGTWFVRVSNVTAEGTEAVTNIFIYKKILQETMGGTSAQIVEHTDIYIYIYIYKDAINFPEM
jgi:hypothetical protein